MMVHDQKPDSAVSKFAGLDSLLAARQKAFEHSGGKIGPAAAHLAEQLEFDDQLRNAVATVLIALLFDPGFGEHERMFELETGSTLDAFVERHCPARRRVTA